MENIKIWTTGRDMEAAYATPAPTIRILSLMLSLNDEGSIGNLVRSSFQVLLSPVRVSEGILPSARQ